MDKFGLQIQKSAKDILNDTNKAKDMRKKILKHKKLVLRFWKKVGKIQDDESFQDEYGGGDSEDYEAWAQAVDVNDGETFKYDYIENDKLANKYKKYGIQSEWMD